MRYCICDSSLVCSSAVSACTWEQQEKSDPKSFHFLSKPHAVFCIRWIKDVCAFMSVHLRCGLRFHPPIFYFLTFLHFVYFATVSSSCVLFCLFLVISSFSLPPFVLPGSAASASVHSVGSTGSETVTQSSLVIGHGHANQTGRNLRLIRILPPAIIVPRQPPTPLPSPLTPHPHPNKINYIPGSIPTIGFPVLKLHYKGTNPKTTQSS